MFLFTYAMLREHVTHKQMLYFNKQLKTLEICPPRKVSLEKNLFSFLNVFKNINVITFLLSHM